MKKIKLLTSLGTLAGLTSVVVPLTTITSCGKSGNLMNEYTPSIKQLERTSFADAGDALSFYLSAVSEKNDIFAQDLRYTLSRGIPQYVSYVSEFCEISNHNFNLNVKNIAVDQENKTITTDFDIKILFDYSKTKKEEMIWYDMDLYKWDATSTVRLVLDFDTTQQAGYNPSIEPFAAKKQMTTYAGATQFGISETNSTIQLLSEKGYYIDLNKQKHKLDPTKQSDPYHFLLPQESYWQSIGQREKYVQNLAEVWDLWYSHPGLQILVLIFRYYMPNNMISAELAPLSPHTIGFGSYYMGNATLNNTFTVFNNQLYGFNLSLDSINNMENIINDPLYNSETSTLTLPNAQSIRDNAFNGESSIYTNLGIPNGIKEVIIPNSYATIGEKAFSMSIPDITGVPGVQKLTIKKSTNTSGLYMKTDAFNQMLSLNEIDLSEWTNSDLNIINWSGAFKNVHSGMDEDLSQGTIYLNSDWKSKESEWIAKLGAMGFKDVYEEGSTQTKGWLIKAK